MGMTGQTAATDTGRLVGKLEADREDEGKDKLDKGLGIVNQLIVSGFIVEIDGHGAVFPRWFGSLSHVSPFVEMSVDAGETSCG